MNLRYYITFHVIATYLYRNPTIFGNKISSNTYSDTKYTRSALGTHFFKVTTTSLQLIVYEKY